MLWLFLLFQPLNHFPLSTAICFHASKADSDRNETMCKSLNKRLQKVGENHAKLKKILPSPLSPERASHANSFLLLGKFHSVISLCRVGWNKWHREKRKNWRWKLLRSVSLASQPLVGHAQLIMAAKNNYSLMIQVLKICLRYFYAVQWKVPLCKGK